MIDVFSFKLGMKRGGGGSNVEDVVYYKHGVTPIIETITPMAGIYGHKVQNTAPSLEDLVGCTLNIYNNGETLSEIVTEDSLQIEDTYIMGNDFASVFEESDVLGFSLTAGLWVIEEENRYISKLYKKGEINVLPTVTEANNGDVLMVVDGKWEEVEIENGNEVAY